jgi:hypothetical protein
MNTFKYFLSIVLFVATVLSCSEDELGNLDFTSTAVAPTNLALLLDITQDNTGLVTLTPNSDGAVSYTITLGDDSAESVTIKQGENIQHMYAEGNYNLNVVATGITGLKTEMTQPLVVSFKAPENLTVTIENDAAISKQVNVTATADFATMFDVYFGEEGNDEPVAGNIGDIVSYTYAEAGIYTIRVVAKGAAIETTEYTVEFEVTEILQPLVSAPTPPTRADVDVISMFSEKYTQTTIDMFVTDWSALSLQEEVAIDGNKTLVYRELNYAGIITEASPMNAANMEYFHFDVWSTNVTTFKTKFVDFNGTGWNNGSDNIEFELEHSITEEGKWISFDIPLSDFDGIPFSDINQMVIAAVPVGTVFLDNMYFWKEPSETVSALIYDDFEGNGNINTWYGDACGMDNTFPMPIEISGAINNSATVLKYEDTGGQYANVGFNTPSNFDLTTNSKFSLKIYVPSSSLSGSQPNQISLKLQDGTAGEPWNQQTEIVKPIVLDQWQTIEFDFATDATLGAADPLNRTDFNRVVLQVNSENNTDIVTAYIDDFNYGIDTGGSTGDSPIVGTWKLAPEENAMVVGSTAGDVWWFNKTEDLTTRACIFDDQYVFNADGSFSNVLGADTWLEGWQGTADSCGAPVAPHNGSVAATYDYNPNAGTITINGTGAYLGISKAYNDGELTAPANAPGSIVYNVTLSDNDNTMDLEILVGGGNVWYFKLVREGTSSGGGNTGGGTSSGSQIDLPVDFESTTIDYTLTDFGENQSSLVTDPENGGNTVVKVIKTAAAATWAGTTIGTDSGFATNIPISLTNSKITVRIWSPDAGTPIRLKIEDANDNTHTCETEVNTTVAGGWETIEFDFTNQASGTELLSVGLGNGWVYNKASIFFNFGTDGATAGEKTYYFDDVIFINN